MSLDVNKGFNMFKEFFEGIPLKVKIAIGVLVVLYTLLLIVATPIAILLSILGLGIWSVITIVNHLTR